MKKYFLPFLTAMAALVLVACSKSDEDPFYGVKAELDDVELMVKQSEGELSIVNMGVDAGINLYSDDKGGFSIWLDRTTTPGTYDLADSEVRLSYIQEATALNFYHFNSGTIHIKKFEHGEQMHIKATFSGVASPTSDPEDKIIITDGEMELKGEGSLLDFGN